MSELELFSKIYMEEANAEEFGDGSRFIYFDKKKNTQVIEDGDAPLQQGYPGMMDVDSDEAQTYDAKRLRVFGFPDAVLDPEEIDKVRKMKEGSQITDKNWITASKIMHTYLTDNKIDLTKNLIVNQDPDIKGEKMSDNDYAEWGRDWMSSVNNNLSYFVADYTRMGDLPKEVAQSFYYLMETSDRDGLLLKNFKTGLYYTFQDAANYFGLTTLGLALIPKYLGKRATKEAIKKSLMKKIFGKPTTMQVIVGADAGAYTMLDDAVRQNVSIDADVQEEYSKLQGGAMFTAGAVLGSGITRATEVGVDVAKKGIDKVKQIRSGTNVDNTANKPEPFPIPDNPFEKNTKTFSLATSKEELIEGAKKAEDARTWYTRHNETIAELFGDDAQLFKELIGVTSQQASVDENIARAMMAYDYLKTHGTFKKLKAKDKNVLNPTEHHLPLLSGVIGNLRRLEGIDPSATGKLATQKGIRERMGYEPTETTFGIKTYLGGNKVPDFVEAMFEGTDEVVTMDRHMIQILFGEKAQVNNSSMAEGKRIITEIANELGWTPKETQAAVWSFNQIKDSDIVKRKGVDLTDVRDYKKAIEERRDAINELVSKFQNPQGQSKSSRSGSNVVTEDNRKTTGAKQETDQLIDPGGVTDGDQ